MPDASAGAVIRTGPVVVTPLPQWVRDFDVVLTLHLSPYSPEMASHNPQMMQPMVLEYKGSFKEAYTFFCFPPQGLLLFSILSLLLTLSAGSITSYFVEKIVAIR